eukprot:CAMPEP_0176390194 /NCGR_PEP_ID=MMETSP0126-20121128/38981_1 /TAXON_ID=141414 ORGANISM="Strombidinopsis acuminatum, Strain SPMC142" /NCGR_SAMPLE_ID=MMETSP0126 /ASSEMBLY_ACC=CAM_ASM_000229 /LENGTH=120 /DNA_ID=CAMNT_0017759461 /DNA_START=1189 /DNA_END=1551 /DNA_ORIENTATION=-
MVRDVKLNPAHDDEYDLDGNRINTCGFLIDSRENIIDRYGDIVLNREILSSYFNQDAEIPADPYENQCKLSENMSRYDKRDEVSTAMHSKDINGNKSSMENFTNQDLDRDHHNLTTGFQH